MPISEAKKWKFEQTCRLRELVLAERNQANLDADLELKRKEQAATWNRPLTIAVLVAALAGFSNSLVAFINGASQRELDRVRRDADIALERTKAESSRVLEMIKTGDTEKAAHNLEFLITAGLVTDPQISQKLSVYLKSRKTGSGPSLPRIGFDDLSFVLPDSKKALEDTLIRYLAYLDGVGFTPSKNRVLIKLDSTIGKNVIYDPLNSLITMDSRIVTDSSTALREYTQHVLMENFKPKGFPAVLNAIEGGVADYFACSFLNEPRIGHIAAGIWGLGTPYIRNLANQKRFSEPPNVAKSISPSIWIYGEGLEIWGGLFWSLRETLGSSVADRLIALSWKEFMQSYRNGGESKQFIAALVKESRNYSPEVQSKLLASLQSRGFSTERSSN